MIYLIKSYGYRGKSVLKIGFTDDIQKRSYQYFSSNPMMEVLSTREGDEIFEKLLHRYLYYLGFQYKRFGRLDEWFIDSPEVKRLFHISRKVLEKKIWKHRDKILDISSSTDFRLFEYLYQKNKEGFIGNEFDYIDGKLTRTKAKTIDISFWSKCIKKEAINSDKTDIVSVFLKKFHSTGIFKEQMKMYCEFCDQYKDNPFIMSPLIHKVDPKFKTYYDLYGTSGCRAVRYEESFLKEKIEDLMREDSLKYSLITEFKIGEKILLKDIKLKLKNIYNTLGINKTPKAVDLCQYFVLEDTKLLDPLTNKRNKGYKIVGIL